MACILANFQPEQLRTDHISFPCGFNGIKHSSPVPPVNIYTLLWSTIKQLLPSAPQMPAF